MTFEQAQELLGLVRLIAMLGVIGLVLIMIGWVIK